jgi:hypothetical protein
LNTQPCRSTNRIVDDSALARITAVSSATWDASEGSTDRLSVEMPRPMRKAMSPPAWSRTAPARPVTPNVNRRLAAVLATVVVSMATMLAAIDGRTRESIQNSARWTTVHTDPTTA